MNIGDVFFDFRGNPSGQLQVDAQKAGEAAATTAGKTFAAAYAPAIKQGLGLGGGIVAIQAVYGAIKQVIGSVNEWIDAAKQDQASQVLLRQALQANIPAWDGNAAGAEKYAQAQIALAFSDEEVRASLGKLVGVTHDLTGAQNLNNIAMDLARAKHLSLAEATTIVSRAAQGDGRSLKSLGIEIGKTNTAASLLAAIQKNVAGTAREWATATDEGKQAVADTKMHEAMETFGRILMPLVTEGTRLAADELVRFTDNLNGAGDAARDNGDPLAYLGKQLHEAFSSDAFAGTGTSQKDVDRFFQPFFDALARLDHNIHGPINAGFDRLGEELFTQFDGAANHAEYAALQIGNSFDTAAERIGSSMGVAVPGTLSILRAALAAATTDVDRKTAEAALAAWEAATKIRAAGTYAGDMWDRLIKRTLALKGTFQAVGNEVADAIFGPQLDKLHLLQINREIATQKGIAADTSLSSAERRNARETLVQLKHDRLAMEVEMALSGELTSTQLGKLNSELLTDLKTASGAEKLMIQELIDKLKALQKQGDVTAQHLTLGGFVPRTVTPGPQLEAFGGPVTAGMPYIVGDAGRPELFVPSTNGTILPQVPPGGGGVTFGDIYLQGVGSDVSAGAAYRFARQVEDAVTTLFQQQSRRRGLGASSVP